MGALPKNKITRVEQGKRRRGNAPKLKRDTHSNVPNHKQGFVAELMRFVGLDKTAVSAAQPEKAESTAVKTAKVKSQAGTKATQASTKVNKGTKVAAPKVRKTVAQSGK